MADKPELIASAIRLATVVDSSQSASLHAMVVYLPVYQDARRTVPLLLW